MCIRDRYTNRLAVNVSLQLKWFYSGAVSYTHLDVYKRQHVLYVSIAINIKDRNAIRHPVIVHKVIKQCKKEYFCYFSVD